MRRCRSLQDAFADYAGLRSRLAGPLSALLVLVSMVRLIGPFVALSAATLAALAGEWPLDRSGGVGVAWTPTR